MLDDKDSAFSYQLRGGLEYTFTERFGAFVEYRYLQTNDISVDRFGGGPGGLVTTAQVGDLNAQSIAIGLKYNI